jgi:hypothetical protein
MDKGLVIADLPQEEIDRLLCVYNKRNRHSMAHDRYSLIWDYIDLTEMVIVVEKENAQE